VEALIVVVVVFRRGDAVAYKDHGARQRSGLRKIERDKLVGEVQRGTVAFRRELEAVRLAQRGVGGDRKGLQIALAGGSDVQLTVVALQERGCLLELRAAGAAAAQFRRCQELDVVEIPVGIDGGGRCESDSSKHEAR